MNSKAWEIRQAFKKKHSKDDFKKVCPICNKELTIGPDDVIFIFEGHSIHYECWRMKTNGRRETSL